MSVPACSHAAIMESAGRRFFPRGPTFFLGTERTFGSIALSWSPPLSHIRRKPAWIAGSRARTPVARTLLLTGRTMLRASRSCCGRRACRRRAASASFRSTHHSHSRRSQSRRLTHGGDSLHPARRGAACAQSGPHARLALRGRTHAALRVLVDQQPRTRDAGPAAADDALAAGSVPPVPEAPAARAGIRRRRGERLPGALHRSADRGRRRAREVAPAVHPAKQRAVGRWDPPLGAVRGGAGAQAPGGGAQGSRYERDGCGGCLARRGVRGGAGIGRRSDGVDERGTDDAEASDPDDPAMPTIPTTPRWSPSPSSTPSASRPPSTR